MSTYEIVTLVQTVLMAMAAIVVWILGRERKNIDEKLAELTKRLDNAGQKSSDLTDDVQALVLNVTRIPEDLDRRYLSKERADDLFAGLRREVASIWREIAALRADRRGR